MPLDGTNYLKRADQIDADLRMWAAEARSGRHKQLCGWYGDVFGTGPVCIWGLAFRLGLDHLEYVANVPELALRSKNDSGIPFSELADMIDAYADARQS